MKLTAHHVVDGIVWYGHCFTMDCFFRFEILVDNMIFKGAVQWVLFTCTLIRCFSWFPPLQRFREEIGVASEVDHHLNNLAIKIIKWHLYGSLGHRLQKMVSSSFFFESHLVNTITHQSSPGCSHSVTPRITFRYNFHFYDLTFEDHSLVSPLFALTWKWYYCHCYGVSVAVKNLHLLASPLDHWELEEVPSHLKYLHPIRSTVPTRGVETSLYVHKYKTIKSVLFRRMINTRYPRSNPQSNK